MVLEFTKMNGAGNDFILIDNRQKTLRLDHRQVARLCDRHRGIGADGLILLVPCDSERADWAWEFYNSDGSTGEMCGNGARCFARFVQARTGQSGDVSFETEAGIIKAQFDGKLVTVNLTRPENLRTNLKLELAEGVQSVHSVNTGVPHAVLFVPDADRAMVEHQGAEIRWHPQFEPKGTNVNFVQVLSPGRIRVRTFERGVEGETLACGTGVTASALVSSVVHSFGSPVAVHVMGGDELTVAWDGGAEFENVRLTGPADFVFEGRIDAS